MWYLWRENILNSVLSAIAAFNGANKMMDSFHPAFTWQCLHVAFWLQERVFWICSVFLCVFMSLQSYSAYGELMVRSTNCVRIKEVTYLDL